MSGWASPQTRRVASACLIVLALCVGVFAIEGAVDAAQTGSRTGRAIENVWGKGGLGWLQAEDGTQGSLAGEVEAASPGTGSTGLGVAEAHLAGALDEAVLDGAFCEQPPTWFAEELFALDGFADVMVASQGTVVGFSTDGSVEDAFEAVSVLLERKGWTCVESGMAGSAAFVKSEGMCTWAWVSCTEVAGTVSVVVQCALSSG